MVGHLSKGQCNVLVQLRETSNKLFGPSARLHLGLVNLSVLSAFGWLPVPGERQCSLRALGGFAPTRLAKLALRFACGAVRCGSPACACCCSAGPLSLASAAAERPRAETLRRYQAIQAMIALVLHAGPGKTLPRCPRCTTRPHSALPGSGGCLCSPCPWPVSRPTRPARPAHHRTGGRVGKARPKQPPTATRHASPREGPKGCALRVPPGRPQSGA